LTNAANVTIAGVVDSASHSDTVNSVCASGLVLTKPAVLTGLNNYIWTIENTTGQTLTLTKVSVTGNFNSGRLDKVYIPATAGTPAEDVNLTSTANVTIDPTVSIGAGNTQIKIVFTKTTLALTDFTLTFQQTGCTPSNP
jgi:hypothetical protein